MALTETRPETDASPTAQEAPTTTLDGLLGSADHKTIGRLWIGSGLLMLVVSLVVSVVAGFEAADLGGFAIVADANEFTQLWSFGRELLLLGGIVPILVGLATYLVPLQIGAPAMAFARGAAGAFWTWFLATDLLIASYLLNGGPGGGRADFVVLWAVALGAMAGAISWALLIIATTVLGARTSGMTLERVPLTTWSFFVFSLIGLLSLPIVMAELVLVYVRVRHGFVPIDARQGLIGVMTPSNLPPPLYWVGVPVLGMAADVIAVHTGRPIKAHKSVMVALGLLGILSYGSHFFGFASVRPLVFDNGLLVVTIAAALLPILGVLALTGDSIRKGTPKLTAALAGALLSGVVFLLGAATAILGLIEPVAVFLERETPIGVDLNRLLILNGTVFHDGVRGLVLGSAVLAIIGALHHWAPKIWGRRMAEPIGFLSVLAAAGGSVLWGFGAVLAGIDDQPAYPAATLGGGDAVEFFNLLAAIGMAVLTVGAGLAALSAAQAAFGRGDQGDDPWTGATLEWATSSPPSFGNFDKPPTVRSATPLADTIDAIDESEVILDDAARAEAADASAEGSQ
ncbi:MAG: cbb3-type cytochrome c oxidase subunit I [Acidimicrobiia bacterium]|nr:cbb3-type cytochrome c oxidase subunit I [Acidimicrobiia bacterium]